MFSKSHTFHLTIVILKGVARLIIFFAKTFVKDMMQCLPLEIFFKYSRIELTTALTKNPHHCITKFRGMLKSALIYFIFL